MTEAFKKKNYKSKYAASVVAQNLKVFMGKLVTTVKIVKNYFISIFTITYLIIR